MIESGEEGASDAVGLSSRGDFDFSDLGLFFGDPVPVVSGGRSNVMETFLPAVLGVPVAVPPVIPASVAAPCLPRPVPAAPGCRVPEPDPSDELESDDELPESDSDPLELAAESSESEEDEDEPDPPFPDPDEDEPDPPFPDPEPDPDLLLDASLSPSSCTRSIDVFKNPAPKVLTTRSVVSVLFKTLFRCPARAGPLLGWKWLVRLDVVALATTDAPTEGPTEGPTDGPTDGTTELYIDAA